MRRKNLLILAFLLMLYIAPMIFIGSYSGVAIPAEQNTTKDFSLSGYGDESPQSITSFSETLPDDVLFYPDSIINATPNLATDGFGDPSATGTYTATHVKDGSSFYTLDASSPYQADLTLEIDVPAGLINNSFRMCLYGNTYTMDSSATTKDILMYNGSSWNDVGDISENGAGWTNITLDSSYIYSQTVYVKARVIDDSMPTVLFDYAEVHFYYMTLADSEHYAESFADVSDWAVYSTGDGIASDGDLGYVEVPNDDAYDFVVSNDISLATEGYYLEFRCRFNITGGVNSYLRLKTGDNYGGDIVLSVSISETTSFATYRYYISSALTTESITIYMKSSIGGVKAEFDYLRISPADEMGWQHDGSTIAGVNLTTGGSGSATLTTDNDILSLDGTYDNYAGVKFFIDTTTTASAIDLDYYPFFELKYRCNQTTLKAAIHNTDGSTSYPVIANDANGYNDNTWRYWRYNVLSIWGSKDIDYVLFYDQDVSGVQDCDFDYFKINSIANYTVSQSGVTTDDYLYVDSGVLYSHISTGYIEANHDPTLDIGTHYGWSLNTSSVAPEVDFYNGAWLGYSSETSGEFVQMTITDLRLKFTDNANIISLTFTDLTNWYDAGIAIIYFEVPVFTGSLDALLIFAGLVMIPASTLYLVKGGKDELSSEKLFYALIVFAIGWGLFLGGIYG